MPYVANQTGYLRKLEPNDLWSLEDTPRSIQAQYEKFLTHLEKYKEKARQQAREKGMSEYEIENAPLPKLALIKALNATFARQWWLGGALKITSDCAQALTPLLSKHLIAFTMERNIARDAGIPMSIGKGVGYALGVSGLTLFNSVFLNQFFYYAMMTGAEVRSVLTHAIYSKALRLSNSARTEFTNGKLTSFVTTDCNRIDFGLVWLHFAWTFPASLAICLVIVLTNIGASGLIGFALLLVCFFVVTGVSRFLAKYRTIVNTITDERVSIMREVLQAMKIIKFYSWEEAYETKIMNVRGAEMKRIRKMLTVRNMINALFVSAPTLAGLVSFVVLERTGGDLNPATVFSSLSSFNIIRMPLMFLPIAAVSGYDAFVAVNRIQELLSASEIQDYVIHDDSMESAVKVTNGSFVWQEKKEADHNDKDKYLPSDEKRSSLEITPIESINAHAESLNDVPMNKPDTEKLVLDDDVVSLSDDGSDASHKGTAFCGFTNINLEIPRGEFVILTGLIGSGKSSLLSAMAGQMHRTEGSVTLGGKLAFCGQQWVQNATVRENILFGQEFDQEWYDTVIEACSLTRDLQILPAGDETEVGERGITISGGQKARINLARAVYANNDIIFLDDVLSAVDAHVGRHIVEQCLCGLLKDKTRILATHQLSMLGHADRVIYVEAPTTLDIGTVDELKERCEGFNKLLDYAQDETESEKETEREGEIDKHDAEVIAIEAIEKVDSETAQDEAEDAELSKSQTQKSTHGKLMVAEERADDAIPLRTYLFFLKFGGGILSYGVLPIIVILVTLATFCQLFTNTWLSFWTGHKFAGRSEDFYIGIFVMFGVLTAILSFGFMAMLTRVVNLTSLRLHEMAVVSVLHAPMSFFDTSPLGRIINRFTKDSDTMDNELSEQARMLLLSFASVVGAFILVIIYLPWFAIALAGLMVLFVVASMFYQGSARELKRLDSLGRSVVFANFSETLTGVPTIRAYPNAPQRFLTKSEDSINNMNSAGFLTIANQRWLAIRLDMVAVALTLVVTMLCVSGQFHISASSVGLVVSSLMQVTGLMVMMVRQLASVENNMNSVERVASYAEDLPQERAFHIPETAPESSSRWPHSGKIEFQNAVMSYQPGLPTVLKDLSISVKSGEKIGICGRTGAGKSTIMVALYRICELTSGSIYIDDIDISTLGLNDLRKHLAIIPQDPVLFQGTVRSNLDPFGTCSDDELLDALRRSWLITPEEFSSIKSGNADFASIKFHLDSVVDDDGANYSLGERQLLALGRALVRKSRILILDEATSSVDFQTDSRIQETIINEFSHCTILCIAHRLNTILGYDRVLVMDSGAVKEFDTPEALMNLPDGQFKAMCDRSNITMEDVMHAKASASSRSASTKASSSDLTQA